MDNTAQDFARKILSELVEVRRLIVDFVSSPPRDSNDSQRQDSKPDRSKQDSSSRSHLPTPQTDPPVSRNNPTCGTNKDRFPKLTEWKPVVEIAGIGVLTVYTLVTIALWCSSREANRISREALTSVQGALISPSPVEDVRIVAPPPTTPQVLAWQFKIGWENGGTTAAKGMFIHTSSKSQREDLPSDYKFPDLWSPGVSHAAIQTALGPKAKLASGAPVSLSADQIRLLLSNPRQWYLYMWGWATYKDVFYPRSPIHLTEFCLKLEGFQGNPLILDNHAIPLWSGCPTKPICYEEDCKDYKQHIE